VRQFLEGHQGRSDRSYPLKTWLNSTVGGKLAEIGEQVLRANQRHPWEIAHALGKWIPAGSETQAAELELCDTIFDREDTRLQLNMVKPEYLRVARSVVQGIFDRVHGRYRKVLSGQEDLKQRVEDGWAGEFACYAFGFVSSLTT
jgi:hypothetical protein